MNQYRILAILLVIFIVGFIGHIVPVLLPIMLIITPYALLLTGALVLYYILRKGELNILVWCLIIYILTFTLEILGTKAGIIFGSYTYGNTLGLKLSGVPLIIGFNWVLVILGAITLAKEIHKNIFLTALLTGTFAVLFDLMLEPVALKLDYWEWSSGQIPLSNYYSWIGISFVASLLYDFLHIKTNVKLAECYFTIQLTYFILLSLFI